MKRLSLVVVLVALIHHPALGGEVPSLPEALAWLQGLPKLGGMVNKELDHERFKKLTLDDLKTLKEIQIGGHPFLENGKLGGHLKLPEGDYRYLTALSALETLKFPENDLGNEALSYIGQVKSLKKLQLMENQITDDGLKHLAGLANLTHLDMRWNQSIAGTGLEYLTGLPKLTHLDLRACQ